MDAQGDGCAGFFIVANLPLATRLSVSYIEDLGFFGYTVVPFGFKVGPSLYYQFNHHCLLVIFSIGTATSGWTMLP